MEELESLSAQEQAWRLFLCLEDVPPQDASLEGHSTPPLPQGLLRQLPCHLKAVVNPPLEFALPGML